jgi:tetratricopeptide (TPR) repeat protein
MNKFLRCNLLSILIFINKNSVSQIDSLYSSIKNYPKEDSVLVEMLVDYCVKQTFNVSDTMLNLANKSLNISKKLKYKIGEIRSLNNIGNYYYQLAFYSRAVEYYNLALNKSIDSKDENNIIISKSNLASLFTRIKETKKAVQLFNECDSILVNRGDSIVQNRAALQVNLGGAYSAANRHDDAINAYTKAYIICKKLNIGFGIILSCSNIGSEYVLKKEFNEALIYLKEAEKLAIENKSNFFLTQINMNLGLVYNALGQTNYAIDYLENAAGLCKQTNENQVLLNTYRNLHPIYFNKNNLLGAYNCLLNYTSLNDSLLGIERQKSINELNIKYDAERKEYSIKELEQKNKIVQLQSKQKSIVLYSIIGLVITMALLTYFLFTRYKTKKQTELLKTKLEDAELLLIEKQKASESEIKAIKSQMNPHFFYNALNSIQGFIYSGEKEKAAESIGLFSDLSRAVLESSRNNENSLYDEINLIENYLKLESMRLPKIVYEINVDQNISQHDVFIPSMIIQPIVENAIKHGLANKSGNGKAKVEVTQYQNQLRIQIDDDGIGRAAASVLASRVKRKGSAFSTEANLNRIELLNENKFEKITCEIIDKFDQFLNPSGTKVIINIPIENYD